MQAYDALAKPYHLDLWTYHLTSDVTVTSFYKGLTPNFNTTSTIYPGTFAKFRASTSIAMKKMGAKNDPQQLAVGAEAQRPPG